MSSYNNITKIKYTDNASDLVRLNEYIIFQDDKAKRKYIVFKFTNNVTQQLLGLQFEVNQYNVDGALIEKSVVAYNKFLALHKHFNQAYSGGVRQVRMEGRRVRGQLLQVYALLPRRAGSRRRRAYCWGRAEEDEKG